MTDLRKAAEMALEALEWYVDEDDVIESMAGNEPWVEGKRKAEKSIQALRQALAQPEQNLVDKNMTLACPSYLHGYTAPPKREWVGLSDDEVTDCYLDSSENGILIEEAIEAKLKEKNA